MTNFRLNAIGRPCAAGLALAALAILPGCVDNDYDLSKDMDLNVTIGTNGLTIPGSSTQMLTLKNLFDLNEDGTSSIKVIKAEDTQKYGLQVGDYVLIQKPDEATESKVEIPEVKLDNISGSEETMHLETITINGMGMQWTTVNNFKNDVNICSYEAPKDIKKLTNATTDLPIDVTLKFATSYSGTVYVGTGFTVTFPSWWTLTLDETNSVPVVLDGKNVLRFTNDYDISHNTLHIVANIREFDFQTAPAGQGLIWTNGEPSFEVREEITCAGKIGADGGQMEQLGVEQVDINLTTTVKPTAATLLSVTGIVDPKIDIAESDFQINDIPEFLAEDGNHLDIYNPQLYFNVTNEAPIDVNFSAMLTPYDDKGNVIKDQNGNPNIIKLGAAYGGKEILIKASGDTRICISRRGASDKNIDTEVIVPNLADLFMTVPSRITITGIEAKVPQTKEYTIYPGTEYNEEYTYEAVIPFMFGDNTTIDYMTSSDDLDTEDFDKFNFESIEISFNAVNGIPLNLTPTLEATGEGGKPLTDIVCKVTGTIAAATANGPSTSKIKAVLTSTADNLGQLKGLKASFTAHTDAQCAGVALNETMGVKFTEVTATLKGNIDVDLNE